MTSRWVLVFDVAAPGAAAIAESLREELGAVVAVEPDPRRGRTVVSFEVDADPATVSAATQLVRAVDVDAERLHDVVVDDPPVDHEPVTVFVEYEDGDEPEPCTHCAGWRHERVALADGSTVLREWHRPDCPDFLAWQ